MKKFLSCLCILAVALTFIPLNVSAASAPDILAESAILFAESDDGTYSSVLFEKNADAKMYPASLVKIMTAVVALEKQPDLDTEFIAYKASLDPLTAIGEVKYLIPGEKMAFRNMLDLLLVPSYNETADVIAYNIAGSIEDFVNLMNDKAEDLGMTGTHFTNAHGLHDDEQYTTARDLLVLCQYAMQNESFAQTVSQVTITTPITNKHSKSYTLSSTNHLLHNKSQPGYVYEGTLGIKTGTTTPAGNCLAAACKKDGMTYYTVVLKSAKTESGRDGRFIDTRTLFDHAAEDFSVQTLLKATQPIVEVPVTLSSDGTSIILLPEKSLSDLIPNSFDYNTDVVFEHLLEEGEDTTGKVVLSYTAPETIQAPVEKGQAVGTLKITFEGRTYEMALLSSSTLTKSEAMETLDKGKNFLESPIFKIIVIVLIALIVVMIVVTIILSRRNKKRKRYGKGRYSR
ncbi:MAG: D-alanyl-D-alanine carboxypeptidase [Clostridia bacterium]|nr:D-alanyl-D-alanine carboxypeptidase [Clostridia bacterium]MBR3865243.1 D-alanyl-D-alanine carboxypeptidase [Clostridia bacterium]